MMSQHQCWQRVKSVLPTFRCYITHPLQPVSVVMKRAVINDVSEQHATSIFSMFVFCPTCFEDQAGSYNFRYISNRIITIISIQPEGRFWQEPEPSQATGMALAHCILGSFLGVGFHCFPPPLDVPTFASRCLHVQAT